MLIRCNPRAGFPNADKPCQMVEGVEVTSGSRGRCGVPLCHLVHSRDGHSAHRTRLVAASPAGRALEALGTLVTEEVVAAEDVVDLEAIRAGVTLADVALQERLVVDDRRPLPVVQEGLAGG